MNKVYITEVQQKFLEYIRWNRWTDITDAARFAIGWALKDGKLDVHPDTRKKQREILNDVLSKYQDDYNTHRKKLYEI